MHVYPDKFVLKRPLADRLRELGVPQNSLFYHRVRKEYPDDPKDQLITYGQVESFYYRPVSAFIVTELWEIIKPHVKLLDKVPSALTDEVFGADDTAVLGALVSPEFHARILIWLLEEKLITL